MNRTKLTIFFIVFIILIGGGIFYFKDISITRVVDTTTDTIEEEDAGGLEQEVHPLSIKSLRDGENSGSEIVIEQTLEPGSNYQRYIASYKSEGLKIYALLTVPSGDIPATGWPVVIFNHGYIPPAQYVTTERYIAYTDAFSRNGYIVFRSDYRGHGNSEGRAEGGYGSNAYTIDVLNAVASIKKLKIPTTGSASTSNVADANAAGAGQLADPNRIGMWGHSMGGHVTLRNMVTNKDIKAGVIWAGVVASYPDLISRWRRGTNPSPFPTSSNRGGWRRGLIEQYGTPEANPEFWGSISANSFLADISGPLQLHHGTADHSVPHEFSETLAAQMKKAGKEVELYIYPGDEHDIPNNFGIAMQRSVEFFDKYLK